MFYNLSAQDMTWLSCNNLFSFKKFYKLDRFLFPLIIK